jgi:hypothetical protein
MNWIFEIYGDTYKALTLLPSSSSRRQRESSFDAEPVELDCGFRPKHD